ncbi:MAG: transglycosylase domain-containing protein [Peptostreptococcaceae bacterium]
MSNDNNENKNKIRRRQVSSSNNKPTSTTTRPSSSNSSRSSKKSNKKDKFKFLRVTGILILVLMVLGVAGGTGLIFASLKDVQPVTKALLDEKTYQTTKIYYANGDLLSNAPSVNKKEPISIDEMPQDLINAIVAIEDERFYEHGGVDVRGLIRSVVKTLTGNKQGGSTISMQVSKMLLTTDKQTLTRKIKDIYYAYEMGKTLSKNDILEVYLNNFFVGKGMAGVKAGSYGYFGKSDPQDLTLAECALLAGSTKYPSKYSAYRTAKLDGSETKEELQDRLLFFINTPDDNLDDPTQIELDMVAKLNDWGLIPDTDTYKQLKDGTMVVRKAAENPDAVDRRNTVLGKMLELGYITEAEYEEARNEEVNIKLPKDEDTVVSSVEDLIEYEVIDALIAQGNTRDEAENMFYNGGLEIHTTIDPTMQDTLESEYNNDNNFPNHSTADGSIQPQSSMVILDYRTGQIKALVGGRHVTGRKTLNRATTAQQPGSTIKPLSVYTPAIDTLKITQSTALSDVRGGYKFNHGGWNPSTTTAGTGSMSLRKALAYSSNTIAVKTAEMLGDTAEECIDIMIDYLKNFGISTVQADDHDRSFASLTLGGMSKGVSPLEMASAYGTLANGGVYIEPTIFTTITSYDGQLIVKNTPEEHKVVDPEVAYVVTDMLQAVVNEGTGGKARLSNNMPVAGKTGTTNKSLDVWFVGYTPYYVGATYIGDDAGRKDSNNNTIARQGVNGGSGSAARLWATVMNKVHKNLVATDFKVPDNVYFTKINLIDGGKSASGSNAAFINGTAPSRYTSAPSTQEKEEEVTPPENEGDTTPDTGGGDGATTPDTGGGDGGATTPDTGDGDGGATTPDTGGGDGGTTTPPDTGGGTPTPPVTETPTPTPTE